MWKRSPLSRVRVVSVTRYRDGVQFEGDTVGCRNHHTLWRDIYGSELAFVHDAVVMVSGNGVAISRCYIS